ncbi:hypothetical protein ACFYXH_05130 [Streptomyces sp. NPDC002730]|uniref:hypothetical protein n=1 Tax=Streptomyces sp. NPDC002730 TaxID=3364662 RepID=UPI0036861910
MVVDEAVAAALRVQPQAHVEAFVASCAERMAQVFTGLRGDDLARSGDVDVVIRLLDDLWDSEIYKTHSRATWNLCPDSRSLSRQTRELSTWQETILSMQRLRCCTRLYAAPAETLKSR